MLNGQRQHILVRICIVGALFHLPLCVDLSVCLPAYLSVCLSVCSSVCLHAACLLGCLSECLSGHMAIDVPVSRAPCYQLQMGIAADLTAQVTALQLHIRHQQKSEPPVSL